MQRNLDYYQEDYIIEEGMEKCRKEKVGMWMVD